MAPFFFFIYYYYFTYPYTFITIPKDGDCIYIEEELPFAKGVNEAQIRLVFLIHSMSDNYRSLTDENFSNFKRNYLQL